MTKQITKPPNEIINHDTLHALVNESLTASDERKAEIDIQISLAATSLLGYYYTLRGGPDKVDNILVERTYSMSRIHINLANKPHSVHLMCDPDWESMNKRELKS